MSRTLLRSLAAIAVAGALLATLAPAVSAADPLGTPRRTWTGSFGANGTGKLRAYTNAMGLLSLSVNGLPRNAATSADVMAGSCSRSIGLITEVKGLRSTNSGGIQRDVRISALRMNRIWAQVQGGRTLSLRVRTGNTTRCANLSSPVATRVVVRALGIDLAVVKPPSTSSYPLCNVAEYLQVRWQPGEVGGTFIYAHAREGMFLPLLTQSQRAGGGTLPGMTVQVYTSNNKVYTYRITQVLRHQVYVPAPSTTSTRLWLQTSEGPRGTRPKLIVVATQVSVGTASYAASHPTPRPVRCG